MRDENLFHCLVMYVVENVFSVLKDIVRHSFFRWCVGKNVCVNV